MFYYINKNIYKFFLLS